MGDLLRALVFEPDYGHYVMHPPSGFVFGLRGGSIEMLRAEVGGFTAIAKTKTRGKAALAFAAHPTEGLIAYGDNAGTFHAQRFDADGFGNATKIVARDRKASWLEFVQNGRVLMIGGMGYLETYTLEAGKFTPLHSMAIPVRDCLCLNDGERILVNQGLHGISAYSYGATGFTKLASTAPGGTVRQMAVSRDSKYLATTDQDSGSVSVYQME